MPENTEQLTVTIGQHLALAKLEEIGENLKADGVYRVTYFELLEGYEADFEALQTLKSALIADGQSTVDIDAEIEALPRREAWTDVIHNVVTTVGKNHMLDNYLAGSGFTQVGPYMGLISSVGWSAVAAADTGASHAGWTEAGSTNAPTFTARIAPSWSAASAGAKAASSAVSFTMTSAGTLQGAFIVLGAGAVTTLMSTAGTLFSAGAFSGGSQVVSNSGIAQVSWSLAI